MQQAEQSFVRAYDSYMLKVRGLADATRGLNSRECRFLLRWCRTNSFELKDLDPARLDAFVNYRSRTNCRRSMGTNVGALRGVLRYLHNHEHTARDLSVFVRGPRIYHDESVPAVPTKEQVECLLKASSEDTSPMGIRDYAALLLMVLYGLRVGEVVRLRLEDIDWRREKFRVSHRKNGTPTEYPLLPEVGEAILRYLSNARPKTQVRALFIRTTAPYVAIQTGAALHHSLERIFKLAGIPRGPRMGPHSLRHMRAATLLRAGASLKTIGDVLGHRSARSTSVYLKLHTEDLRMIALNVPTAAR
jgi:integrase/recombinase XerD